MTAPAQDAAALVDQCIAQIEGPSLRRWATDNREIWIKIAADAIARKGRVDPDWWCGYMISVGIGL